MAEVTQFGDAAYVVIVDGGTDLWGQFQVQFLNGVDAPATEVDRDQYARDFADYVKALYPTTVVTMLKTATGSKYDSDFYTAP